MPGPWDTPPTPEELAAQQAAPADPWAAPPSESELKGLPQVGGAHAAALGLESGIPFASSIHAALTAGARTPSSPEMQVPTPGQLKKMYPGMDYLTAHRTWYEANRPDIHNAELAEQDRQRTAEAFTQAKGEREQLRDAAWDQHPWLYGAGKVGGFVLTDKGLGAVAPVASFSKGVPSGVSLGQKLLPAARAGGIQGALYGASEAPDVESMPAGAARGFEWGVATGPAGEAVATGLGNLGTRLVNRLGRAAEQNTLRAANAPGEVGKLVTREGGGRPAEVARAALDEGLPLKSPADMLEGARGALNEKYGPAIGQLTQAADQQGATFNMGNVLKAFQQRVPEMMKDPQQQPLVAAVQDYLQKVMAARGQWNGETRQLMLMSPSEAHGLRQNLDTYLRGVQKTLDPTNTLSKVAFNDIRHAVDDELGRAMESVGLGRQWSAANAGYRNMSAAAKLARGGVRNEAVAAAGTQGETLLSKLKDFKLPGPKPSTKASVQNTLYRLLRPQGEPPNLLPGAAAGATGAGPKPLPTPAPGGPIAPPAAGAGPSPADFTIWRPSEGQPPIPLDPEAYTPRPAAPPPGAAEGGVADISPEELAKVREEVLRVKQQTRKDIRKSQRRKPMPSE